MANGITHKQSSVPGKVPTTAQLVLGELAINTTDGKLFLKKNVSGTESVVEIGLAHLTESYNNSAPNTTVPVAALTATGSATDIDLALASKGTGALVAQIADATIAGGNKRGSYAVDWQSTRIASTSVASGFASTVGGGHDNRATAGYSVVSGGRSNGAGFLCATVGGGEGNNAGGSGHSTVGGGYQNNANGSASVIGGGFQNSASGVYGTVCGGQYNAASGSWSSIGAGRYNTASGPYSTVSGGNSNTASGAYTAIPGGIYGTTNGIQGLLTYGFVGAALGQTQMSFFGGRADTTGATATRLTADAGAASASNQLTLRNNSAFRIRGTAVARNTATNDAKEWTFETLIKRGASAAATSIVGTPTIGSAFADASTSSWALAITADTTNGALAITGTGAASTAIRWMAVIHSIEVA